MIATILLAYFVGGLVILFIFDLLTKRIRSNMQMAGTQAQIRMAEANTPITPRVGLIVMLVLTWLFWPMVLIGAATDTKGGNDDGKTEQGKNSPDTGGSGGPDSNPESSGNGEQPDRPSDSQAS